MKIPVFSTEACLYDNLNDNCKIFNSSELEYYLWIKLPSDITRDCELYQIDEILDKPKVLDWQGFVCREENHPWLRFTFGILKQCIGMHIYRLHFINKYTNDVFSLYFSYIIQNDNPKKPYVYMNTCCTGGCYSDSTCNKCN